MMPAMRDHAEFARRAALAKQSLLLALKHANSASLDGSGDAKDMAALSAAFEQATAARDALDQLRSRLDFHLQLAAVRNGTTSDESSRFMVAIVRRGVEGGYPIEDVRRLVDEALGRG